MSRKKRILCLMLSFVIAASMSGCKKQKKDVLENTILENAHLYNCDGKIVVGNENQILFCGCHENYKSNQNINSNCYYNNYRNVEDLGLLSEYISETEKNYINNYGLNEEYIHRLLVNITLSEQFSEEKTLILTGK